MENRVENGADRLYQLDLEGYDLEVESGLRRGRDVLPSFLERFDVKSGARILDVGCGIGAVVEGLIQAGFRASGLEPGGRHRMAISDQVLPYFTSEYIDKFPNEKFDVVMSFGVIEHVGTVDGHDTLAENYEGVRAAFYSDCLDLLLPGGLLIVFGPNKLFPFDLQHGPAQYSILAKLKKTLPTLNRLTIPWHKKNFLVSWSSVDRHVRKLACERKARVTPYYPPQKGFVIGGSVRHPILLKTFNKYTGFADQLPKSLSQFLHTHTLYVARIEG
jgi:SAM-dependent methyltransferase